MNCVDLSTDMKYLFRCDYFAQEFDPEGNEEHLKFSETVLAQYLWNDIYEVFYKYLTMECCTKECVYNAINLFFYYCFDENPIPNPYELAGYILYRIDLIDTDENWKRYGDFMDGFMNKILEKSGYLNLIKNPYYCFWEDPKVLAAKECWADALMVRPLEN